MNPRVPRGLKLGAVVAVLLIGAVGLAYAAGVDLPGQASDKAEEATASVDRPEHDDNDRRAGSRQGEGSSVSDDVHEVIDDRDGGGCEFGQAVAEAARANSHADDPGSDNDCDHEGSEGSNDENDNKAAKEAKAKDHDAQGSRATGHENSAKDDDEGEEDERDDDAHRNESADKDKAEHDDDDDDDDDDDELEDEGADDDDRGQGHGSDDDE